MVNGKTLNLTTSRKEQAIRPHQKLDAWSKSVDLVVEIYRATERFPREERYVLTYRYDGLPYPSRLILPRALGVIPRRNSPIFCTTHKDPRVSLKLN